MLGVEHGGLRPWELQDFTPAELGQVFDRYSEALTRARRGGQDD